MKKQLFTFVMMIALVIVTGSAMGQGSNILPEIGSTKTYTVNGLTSGDTYAFIVSSNLEDIQNAASTVPNTEYAFVGASSGPVIATGIVTAQITWKKLGNYRVWITVTDAAGGCINYLYVPVEVVHNNFNVSIIALGTGDERDTDINAKSEVTTDCPKFVDENFIHSADNNEGSTYAYFKVTRSVTTASTSNWTLTPAISGTAEDNITKWESSINGANWSQVGTAVADMEGPFVVTDATGTDDYVWFRATLTNIPVAAATTLIFDFGTSAQEVSSTISDKNTVGLNTATLTISPLPTIGTFTGL